VHRAQDALWMLDSFFPITPMDSCNFYLLFGEPLAFWEGILYFHKIKGKKTLSISHKDLNTMDNGIGLTESFSHQLS
jgi:hypothetical protein